MTNIVVRAPIVWLYLHICRPYNILNFPLSVYMYAGQTIYPDDRQLQHFEENKNNPKYTEILKLVSIQYWEFLAWPIFRFDGETDDQYYNRVSIIEQKIIRGLQLCYCTSEYNSPHGLNASIGGESSLNSGYRTLIPGRTTGVKHIFYRKDRKSYGYQKHIWQNGKYINKTFFKNQNPFVVYLYAKSLGEKNIIIDRDIFWDTVKKWWNNNIYGVKCFDYLGIKNVSLEKNKSTKRKFAIRIRNKKYEKQFVRTSFSKVLQLYQDGILDVNDIYCLDFFVWNAKLVLEGKFNIKYSRPDVFYDDFLRFRKIHHFSVDNLKEAIDFLKIIESLTDISIPVGQQRLQCT